MAGQRATISRVALTPPPGMHTSTSATSGCCAMAVTTASWAEAARPTRDKEGSVPLFEIPFHTRPSRT